MSDLISRQAAITVMTNYFAQWAEYTAWSKTVKAMVETAQEAARKMLTELPSEQVRTQMSSAELISRKAAIDALREYIVDDGIYDMDENVQGFNDGISCAINELSVMPSAEPDRRRGRWEFVVDKDWAGGEYYRCSACGWGYSCKMYHEPDEFEHCPHCGAEMGPGKEEKGDS